MSPQRATLHMIGNAHIDPVWLWPWQEGFHEALATFRSMLDRLHEYPDFVFTSSSAALYEWVEQNNPAMFAEIKQRVTEGRWQIVGGWWLQPDCNIPCGESFVRQGLYGQRYFRDKLGTTARVGYNPDSFGHAGMLPQILKKCGMDYYVFMRPGPHEKRLPGRLFWWQADDGSRVLAYQIPQPYNAAGERLAEQMRACATDIGPPAHALMCYYGVGNHGGGPTKESIERILAQRESGAPVDVIFSSPQRFFDSIAGQAADLPIVHDDLQHHASGCYAAHSGIKRWNRQAENLLLAAEKMSAIASVVTGQPYPADLNQAWKSVLFNQFHDILAGTSLESAYDDARNDYGEALAIAGRALNQAAQSLAWQVNIPAAENDRPLVAFNPHPWPLRANVEIEMSGLSESDVLLDDQDRPLPWQAVQSQATTVRRRRLSFLADLPALGYRAYRLASGPAAASTPAVRGTDNTLENAYLKVTLDEQTGQIASLFDKRLQREVFAAPAARAVVIDDASDTWSHAVYRYDRVAGEFAARRVKLLEQGAVKAVIRIESAYGQSVLWQDITLYAGIDQVEVAVTVDWREQRKMLKLRFPVNVARPTATYETPYGHIIRPCDGEEEPGQAWLDVSGNGLGLSVLNDGKYSFDVSGNDIGLTVLRSAVYAHHVPAELREDGEYAYQDQGRQRFTYALAPHAGDWRVAQIPRRAAALNQQPWVMAATFHAGTLPTSSSFATVSPHNLILTVMKRAEDNDDVILRCYESAGQATSGTIELPFLQRRIALSFTAHEIKTVRIPRDPSAPASEPSMLEWDE